jgi:hypothetical protein
MRYRKASIDLKNIDRQALGMTFILTRVFAGDDVCIQSVAFAS